MKTTNPHQRNDNITKLIYMGLPYVVATNWKCKCEIHGAFALEEDARFAYECLLNSESWKDGVAIELYNGLNVMNRDQWSNKKDADGSRIGFICERGE